MDDKTREALTRWWENLTDEQRAELLPLEEGHLLPPDHVSSLTNALGIGPAGWRWVESGEGYTFYIDARLGPFLAEQREA